jgi:hypothetical protein
VKCIRGIPDIALAMIASTSMHLHHLVQRHRFLESLAMHNLHGVTRTSAAQISVGMFALEQRSFRPPH